MIGSKIKKPKFKLNGFIERPLSAFDWIIFCIIAFFCFISFQQVDIFHTGGSSFAYLNGHILDFYDYNVQYMGGNAYLPSTYILFAIWNIPIYLLKLVQLPSMTVPWIVTMWYKALTTLFYFLSGFVIYKIGIVMGLGVKKSKLTAYIFLTAPLAFFSQFIFGQYDIFTVFFVLLGIYFYFKNDIFKFIIFFGIAITFKYFAFLIFLPLLLLKEKNILKIIRNSIVCAIPFILEVLIYFRSPAFRSGVFGFGAKNYIFASGLMTSHTSISIVVVLWILVSTWAFFIDTKDNNELIKWSLYLCNIVIFLIFGLSMWHPQWLIFAVPFMIMSSVINKKFEFFMIIEIVLMLIFTIFTVNFWINHVDQALMFQGIFRKVLDGRLGSFISMRSLFIIHDQKLIFSCITALFLINAIFKHPKFTVEKFNESIDKSWNIVRTRFICGVAIWIVPSLICMISSFYAPFLVVNNANSMAGNINQMTEGRVVEQYFTASKETICGIQIVTGTYQRKNNSTINISMQNTNTNNIIFSQNYSSLDFNDNAITNFNFNDIKVDHGVKYKIIIQAKDVSNNNEITFYHTAPETVSDTVYLLIDGRKTNYNLSLNVLGK